MRKTITKFLNKIKLHNYKRFQDFEVEFNEELNLLIGDNEAGKSSILSAIDIVLSGSRNKIETLGLDNLFNVEIIQNFLGSEKKYEDLPKLFIEIYLNEQDNFILNGNVNSNNVTCDGLRLICEPNDDLSKEIKEILKQEEANFPFEYYSIQFKTFSGENYSGYRKFLKHILIDNAQISNEYAAKQYVKTMYYSVTKDSEKNKHQNEYRKHKQDFENNVLSDVNSRINNYSFSIKTNSRANLETDLTISEDSIEIENKGKGRQCLMKTEFALQKNESGLDVVLIEEPENHLSHINMKKLIRRITSSENKQLLIATHNNMVSTRLDLRKSILLNSSSHTPLLLNDLTEETAKFFMKAPNNNILEFVLSKKVILVEGNAEYILLEAFYNNITSKNIEDSDIHIISVGGTSFKRYLEISKILKIKTAVIRDNDKDYQKNCVDNYIGYVSNDIKIFYDEDDEKYTFEILLYGSNAGVCVDLFSEGRETSSIQEYMLKNKTNVAFKLLDKKYNDIIPPEYIKKAIKWIKE